MAIQNNLKATFYGKVGQLVGMRWKDITTVRQYVIPKNPRTPLQQANRERFTEAVAAAQEGLRINKGAPCWVASHMTEFQFRVKTAKERIDTGNTGWSVLPLFPNGYSPAYELVDLYATFPTSYQDFTVLSSNLASIDVDRRLFLGIYYFDVSDGSEKWVYDIITRVASTTLVFKGMPQDADLSKEVSVFFVSIDDAQNGDVMVYAPLQIVNS